MVDIFKKSSNADTIASDMLSNLNGASFGEYKIDKRDGILKLLETAYNNFNELGFAKEADVVNRLITVISKKKKKNKKKLDKNEKEVLGMFGFSADDKPVGKTDEESEYFISHEGPGEAKREMTEEALLDAILNESNIDEAGDLEEDLKDLENEEL